MRQKKTKSDKIRQKRQHMLILRFTHGAGTRQHAEINRTTIGDDDGNNEDFDCVYYYDYPISLVFSLIGKFLNMYLSLFARFPPRTVTSLLSQIGFNRTRLILERDDRVSVLRLCVEVEVGGIFINRNS